MNRLIAVLCLAACGGTSAPSRTITGWSGTVTTSADGSYDAALYLGEDEDGGVSGSFVAGIVGLTGGVVGGADDAGFHFTITPSACAGSFDAGARVVGSTMQFSYTGSSCVGTQSGTATLTKD